MNKIKLALIVRSLKVNGISEKISNYTIHLDKEIFDIFVISGDDIANKYLDIFNDNNINLIKVTPKWKNIFKYIYELNKILKENRFDIVEVHGNSATVSLELLLSKINGVPLRIAHSHNTTCKHKILNVLLKPALAYCCNCRFSCGVAAGKWLFNKKNFYVISNAFDTSKFYHSEEFRSEIRFKLNIDKDTIVLGHVGKFNEQKNHKFLLEIFKSYLKINNNSRLLLVGNGPKFNEVKKRVVDMNISNYVIFLGETTDVNKIYSAIDILVFPSLFEGLPVTLLETQYSGTPALVSDRITEEVAFTNWIHFYSLNKSSEEWTYKINSILNENNIVKKGLCLDDKLFYKYDIISASNVLKEIYLLELKKVKQSNIK